MVSRRSLIGVASVMASQFSSSIGSGSSIGIMDMLHNSSIPMGGTTAADHVPTRAQALDCFGRVAVPDLAPNSSRLLRWSSSISIQLANTQAVVGAGETELAQLFSYHFSKIMAHTRITTAADGTPGSGQIIILLVKQLGPNSLDGSEQLYNDLLSGFWGGSGNLTTARENFVSDVTLPIVAHSRSVNRWLVRPNGRPVSYAVVIEGGTYNIDFIRRFRREIARAVGLMGYSIGLEHSLFNLNSLALDLTALDVRILQTLYDPRLVTGMDRDSALRTAAEILAG
jgi:hypothetical protein